MDDSPTMTGGVPDQDVKSGEPEFGKGGDGGQSGSRGRSDSTLEPVEEQYDTRYTGEDSKIEKNDAPANAKTTLEDITMQKPKVAKERGEQSIPLEYRDILK